jgi:thiol-disulfide isomerase/thioredoxin
MRSVDEAPSAADPDVPVATDGGTTDKDGKSFSEMSDQQFAHSVRKITERGDYEKAIGLISERSAKHPDSETLKRSLLTTKIQYGETLARLGDLSRAADVMKEIGTLGRELFSGSEPGSRNVDFVATLLCEARAHAYASNVTECVNSLQEAMNNGFGNLDIINRDPFFAKLRSSDDYANMIDQLLDSNTRRELAEFAPVAFDFTLEDLNGRSISLNDSNGKIRVIDVWGTWCQPCLSELPSIIRLQNEYKNDVTIIGINIERADTVIDARRMVQAVVDEMEINYTCVIGDQATTQSIPSFSVFPTKLFIDRNGRLRLTLAGTQSYDKLTSVVDALVAEEPESDIE